MNRRGIFTIALGIVTIFLAGMLVVTFFNLDENSGRAVLGKIQTEVISSYGGAEKALFYIDEAAGHSSYKAFSELSSGSGCGSYEDKSVWLIGSQKCFPNFKKLYSDRFNSALNEFFISYEDVKIPLDNYNIIIDKSYIQGEAINKLVVEKEGIIYSVSPNFRIESEISLDSFEEISKKAEETYDLCRESIDCWKVSVDSDWQIDVREEGKVFMFSVPTHQKMKGEEIVIDFVLNFNPLLA